MGILSWFRRTRTEALTEVPQGAVNPEAVATVDSPPAPARWPAHSRAVTAASSEDPSATADGVAPVQTVRRFFASLAAANDRVFARSLAELWEQVSVERYFMSITGPRPTINRAGQVCSETLGTMDDAFAAFQWD